MHSSSHWSGSNRDTQIDRLDTEWPPGSWRDGRARCPPQRSAATWPTSRRRVRLPWRRVAPAPPQVESIRPRRTRPVTPKGQPPPRCCRARVAAVAVGAPGPVADSTPWPPRPPIRPCAATRPSRSRSSDVDLPTGLLHVSERTRLKTEAVRRRYPSRPSWRASSQPGCPVAGRNGFPGRPQAGTVDRRGHRDEALRPDPRGRAGAQDRGHHPPEFATHVRDAARGDGVCRQSSSRRAASYLAGYPAVVCARAPPGGPGRQRESSELPLGIVGRVGIVRRGAWSVQRGA